MTGNWGLNGERFKKVSYGDFGKLERCLANKTQNQRFEGNERK